MKRAAVLMLAVALAGCTGKDETAAAIKAFGEACKAPMRATLTLSQWGNDLALDCADMKFTKDAK